MCIMMNVSSLVIYSNESSGCIFEYVIKMHIQMCRHDTHSNVLSWYTLKCGTFESVIMWHIQMCHHNAHRCTSECVIWCTFEFVTGWHIQTNIFIFEYIQIFTLSISNGVGIFYLSHLVTIIKMLTHGLHRVKLKLL